MLLLSSSSLPVHNDEGLRAIIFHLYERAVCFGDSTAGLFLVFIMTS